MAKGLLPPWFRTNINNSSSSSSSSNSSSSNNPNEEEEEAAVDTDLRLGPSNYVRRRGDQYVKVYLDGFSIGRSINLSDHHSYDHVVSTVRTMFTATLLWPYVDQSAKNAYMLTYEDSDGDWMMFGDVPWQLFLKTVKKLRISKSRGNN